MSSERPSATPPRALERSAGGVVVRGSELVAIVPTRRAADGSKVLALPKGHIDSGETPIEAAQREVREETGIVAEPLCELGEARYWYRRDIADHDEEVEEVRWLELAEAQLTLSHAAEREMVALALAYLEEAHKDR